MERPSKQAERERRRQQVAAMLLAHRSQRQIAQALGVHQATVSRDVQAVRREWQERRLQDIHAWVAEETAKLDHVERALVPRVLDGELPAVDRLLNVMRQRAQLLGLDEPQQHQHTVITMDAVEQEIAALEAQIGEHADGQPSASGSAAPPA